MHSIANLENMKPYLKAIIFLISLTILDFLLRKGLLAYMIPFKLPPNLTIFFLFSLFEVLAWIITKWFCKADNIKLLDLGIGFDTRNRFEFFYGLTIGIVLWAVVSMVQSAVAGFAWTVNPNFNLFNIFYGFIFIFIADLGTELFTRGYPLRKFKDSVGATYAIIIMVLFVGLKSFSFGLQGGLLFYTMLIPALHTVFFSIIYFKTKRLGGALGVHTGANLVTISIFDLRIEEESQIIPTGLFHPNVDLQTLSLSALQLPYVFMAILFSIVVFLWWRRKAPNTL